MLKAVGLAQEFMGHTPSPLFRKHFWKTFHFEIKIRKKAYNFFLSLARDTHKPPKCTKYFLPQGQSLPYISTA